MKYASVLFFSFILFSQGCTSSPGQNPQREISGNASEKISGSGSGSVTGTRSDADGNPDAGRADIPVQLPSVGAEPAPLISEASSGSSASSGPSVPVEGVPIQESAVPAPAADSDGSPAHSGFSDPSVPMTNDAPVKPGPLVSAPPSGDTEKDAAEGRGSGTPDTIVREDSAGQPVKPSIPENQAGTSIIAADSLAPRAVGLLSRDFQAVTRRGRPLSVIFDFDGNGYTDVCILAVTTVERGNADVESLSDYSRVFRDPPERILFSLEQFLQDNGKLRHSASISLGRKLVFESMSLLPLSKNDPYPIAVAVEFLTAQGSETEWVIFYGETDFSRFTLPDTTESTTLVGDIDRDGILDIMFMDRSVEAGTGYEMFITLFQWAEGEYREKGTINIVRNLRTFLKTARERLVFNGTEDFLKFALPERTLKEEAKSRSSAQIVSRIFSPAIVPGTGKPMADNPLLQNRKIVDVFFPDITENPFTFDDDRGYRFSLPLRISFEGNEDYYFNSTIQINRNPFSSRQYFFVLR